MVQPSDKNGSNRSDENGSVQAEQILDSIIEHIESTDKPLGDETIQTKQIISTSEPTIEHLIGSQTVGANATSSFKDIERRAADLAKRLGGAGLSYSLGAKKHFDNNPDIKGQGDQQISPVVAATIHDNDIDTDNEQFGISHGEELRVEEMPGREISRQELHVSEWNAELKEDRSVEHSVPFVAPVDVEIAPDNLDSLPLEQHLEVQADIGLAPPQEVSQGLHDIEAKIEELSSSMRSQDYLDAPIEETQIRSDQEMILQEDVSDDVEQRVNSLEMQIVKLLDDVSLSEQRLSNTVSDIVRSEMQNAVQGAIESSANLGLMKTEMVNAVEQRHLQEIRMNDSLDALHDALKDIGERVKSIETDRATVPQMAREEFSSGGGIISSVLGSAPDTMVSEPQVEESVSYRNKPDQVDELPVWLSDATQDLHGEELDAPEVLADVFASDAQQADNLLELSAGEDAGALLSQVDAQPDHQEPEVLDEGLMESELGHSEGALTYEEGIVSNEEMVVAPLSAAAPTDNGAKEGLDHQETIPEKSDFLRSARAAARAANERSGNDRHERNKAAVRGEPKIKNVNFVAAAKQKVIADEIKQVSGRIRNTPKNSLFSDKVQGPNSLLIFTSLILFGTSALLLYGMSKNNADGGSVVKLNAIEKNDDQQSPISKMGSSKNLPAAIKMNTSSNIIDKKRINSEFTESGSNSKPNIVIAEVTLDFSDTLSESDRKEVSSLSQMASKRSPVEFTGAIPDSNIKPLDKGSLFDQYSSFSAPSSGISIGSNLPKKSQGILPATLDLGGVSALLSSASNGDFEAQYEVARRFGKGIGVKRSPAISVEWYEKSAKAGYAPAIYRLATMYERGKGVAKDYKRAMRLYTSAANKGNVKAMHNLAVLYTGGNLGKADYVNAINWYEKAAEFGVKDSQFNLAIIYQNGMGGALDLEKAFKWYSLAARAGDQEAKEMVKDIRPDLTAVQREKLEQILRNWKPKTRDKNANVVSQYRKASLEMMVKNKSKTL